MSRKTFDELTTMFEAMPKEKIIEHSKNLLSSNVFSDVDSALYQYCNELYDKEIENKYPLTDFELEILKIQADLYREDMDKREKAQEVSNLIDNIYASDERYKAFMRQLNDEEKANVMAAKPKFSELPEGVKCIALRIDDDFNWHWIFSQFDMSEEVFIMHESVDGSVEKRRNDIKKKANSDLIATGCKCICHNPYQVCLHIMPCCTMVYKKMFTNLLKE